MSYQLSFRSDKITPLTKYIYYAVIIERKTVDENSSCWLFQLIVRWKVHSAIKNGEIPLQRIDVPNIHGIQRRQVT